MSYTELICSLRQDFSVRLRRELSRTLSRREPQRRFRCLRQAQITLWEFFVAIVFMTIWYQTPSAGETPSTRVFPYRPDFLAQSVPPGVSPTAYPSLSIDPRNFRLLRPRLPLTFYLQRFPSPPVASCVLSDKIRQDSLDLVGLDQEGIVSVGAADFGVAPLGNPGHLPHLGSRIEHIGVYSHKQAGDIF